MSTPLVVENETITINDDITYTTVNVNTNGILNILAHLTTRSFIISGSGAYTLITGSGILDLESGIGLPYGFYDEMGNLIFRGVFITRILERKTNKTISLFIPPTKELLQTLGSKNPLYVIELLATGSISSLQTSRNDALNIVGIKGYLITNLISWLPLTILSCERLDVGERALESKFIINAVKVI